MHIKFKVGDLVKCITIPDNATAANGDPLLVIGNECLVIDVDECIGIISLLEVSGSRFSQNCFELVPQRPLAKVGDKVICERPNSGSTRIIKDAEYTVSKVVEELGIQYYHVDDKKNEWGISIIKFYANRFKLVEATCTCDTRSIMMRGCICGQMARELAIKLRVDPPKPVKPCTCDIQVLMAHGCRCG